MSLPTLYSITLDELIFGLDQNKFTSVHLVETYIARTREVQDDFRAVLEINPDAVDIAAALDEERRVKGRRGPLHGVPIFLKDNMVTFDKMSASAGSFALLGSKPLRESAVAQRLRKAGAIILGKTNLSEWANMRSSNAIDGWSARGGQTMGVYCHEQNPEGSSSGSGVATTLGLSFAAIGTETSGSLVCPAQNSNVVTIKPTVGLTSRDGVIPLSARQDTVGPMARTVKDAAHILSIIAGKDEHDPYTEKIPFEEIPDYSTACSMQLLHGKRIGVPRNVIDTLPSAVETFDKTLQLLGELGATIVDNANFTGQDEYNAPDDWLKAVVMSTDFKISLNNYLKGLTHNPQNITDLTELIKYTKSDPREEFGRFDVAVFEDADGTIGVDDPTYQEGLEKELYLSGEGGILGALERDNLDAIVVPSLPETAVTFAAIRGLPAITVPLGLYPENTKVKRNREGNTIDIGPGLPFCVTVFGREFSEHTLLSIAYGIEQLTQSRSKIWPMKLPTVDLSDIVESRKTSAYINEYRNRELKV